MGSCRPKGRATGVSRVGPEELADVKEVAFGLYIEDDGSKEEQDRRNGS